MINKKPPVSTGGYVWSITINIYSHKQEWHLQGFSASIKCNYCINLILILQLAVNDESDRLLLLTEYWTSDRFIFLLIVTQTKLTYVVEAT
ncbi:hypothetical protein GS682_26855 [Nostoc sp. B(2019)]|nr:hypothetical protein [Nostoc sp. B(2019)]